MTDSAIWLTCRDCGHTTRVLALMANRALKARTHCPACQSTCEPCLNQTLAGTGIALSAEQSEALREMDDKNVRAWLEHRARTSDSHLTAVQWIQAAGSRLADRFGNGGATHHAPFAMGHEAGSKQVGSARQGDSGFHGTGTISETGSAAVRL